MQVADLELCKELYELSGWDNTTFFHVPPNRANNRYHISQYKGLDKRVRLRLWFPAYDLGYMLRKLPNNKMIALVKDVIHNFKGDKDLISNRYSAHDFGNISRFYADTPENALCKLAIELFKQGILTKEGNDE